MGKFILYLIGLMGLGLAMAGLMAGAISGFDPLVITLLILGATIMATTTGIILFRNPLWKQRWVITGSNITVSTIGFISLLGALNFYFCPLWSSMGLD
ncbi:MAG: hypothetical protein HC796_06815 [Synechococcaceae cyanobacterium RL_1_2]|nr:hypothetical protein [Synechococcaceae cyanobacterium RL_1_2]